MNKKGFTLAELLGIILITATILLIIVPVVDKQIKDGKKEIYDNAIDTIKSSLDLYMTDYNLDVGQSMQITLYQLKQKGLVDLDIKNPNTGELFANDMIITIKNEDGIIKYEIDDTSGTNKRDYDSIPKLVLNTSVLEYVEFGEEYNYEEVTASYNDVVLSVTADTNLDTNKIGNYKIVYKTSHLGIENKIIKTVIVRDTKGPSLDFNTLNISLSEAKTYDYESDILVSDLSGIKDIEVETNFGALKGTYSVKYIVTDNAGNQTIKHRKVVTS